MIFNALSSSPTKKELETVFFRHFLIPRWNKLSQQQSTQKNEKHTTTSQHIFTECKLKDLERTFIEKTAFPNKLYRKFQKIIRVMYVRAAELM